MRQVDGLQTVCGLEAGAEHPVDTQAVLRGSLRVARATFYRLLRTMGETRRGAMNSPAPPTQSPSRSPAVPRSWSHQEPEPAG